MNPAPRTVTARIFASLLLLSALLGAGPVRAQSPGSTIAGPFTVILPSTSTFSFSRNFNAPTPIQGSYLLRVELGTANSLTTLSVRLNGAQLYSLADFAGGVTRVDRVVTLAASNTLSLSVAGAKGTRITLTVFTVVMPKPTALAPNPLPLTIGSGGTLTATLSPAPTAAGTLTVSSGNTSVATVPGSVSFASGQSSVAIAVNALAPGSATVTASANGGQASAVVAVDAPPAVNITAPGANSVYQAGANITIAADAADPDGTVAKVDFYQGAMLLGSATIVPYSFTWVNVQPGSYSLTAVATDNQEASNTSSAVTIRVNAAPTVSLTNPTSGATFTAAATISLAATATDSDGSVTQVDFYQGSTLIGSATSAPFTFSWANATAGSYALAARATDNDGAVGISDVVNITVNSGVAQIYYIVPDHLNTPRLIQDQSGNAVWRNDNAEPFGDSVPNDDPSNTGNHFDFPLRLSNYYVDRETGNFYAMLRDAYGPDIGRFPQSDPIGLKGGSLSPYLYVNNNPLGAIDPLGLVNWKGTFGGISFIKGAGSGFFRFDLTSECKCNKRIRIQGYVSTVAAGIGAKYTGTGASAEFYDYRDCPDAGIANGAASIISAGSVFGGGISCSKMTIGHLYASFSCGGPTYGFDFSAGAYIGASVVTDAKEECCGK